MEDHCEIELVFRSHDKESYALVCSFAIPASLMNPGPSFAGPTNGGFEAGNLSGWTLTNYRNSGISYSLPMTRAKLNLGGASIDHSPVVTTGSGYVTVPLDGTYAASVNDQQQDFNVNAISQTFTVTDADRGPDGKIHIVFAVAPVLDTAGHTADALPYFFIEVNNLTKGTNLYRKFNYAGEPGVAWNYSGTYAYTDWQVADIAPGDGALATNDQIHIEIIGAGCSGGAHGGWVYVDAVGSSYPGLTVSASGPVSAVAGSNITYALSYSNGGGSNALNTVFTFQTPPNTTYQSVSLAGCTTPSVGGTGTVTCNLGTVNAGSYGTFSLRVNVNSGATGTITNGDYNIQATGMSSPMSGIAISTDIFAPPSITTSGGSATVNSGGPAVAVDPGLTVSYSSTIDGARVFINNFFTGDTLACPSCAANGLSASFSSTTGVLTISGTAGAAAYTSALRSVTIGTSSPNTSARTVSFNIGAAVAYSANGHFYEYVPSGTINWTAARVDAETRSLYGLQGYLSTITSSGENDFIRQKLQANAWIGSSDDYSQINNGCSSAVYANQAASEGHWYWVTGPETCTHFSDNNNTPVAFGGAYMNWSSGEPNNQGSEHYGEIYSTGGATPGSWNDLPDSGGITGYVVEYGGMSGDPTLTLTGTRNVNVMPQSTLSGAVGSGSGTIVCASPVVYGNTTACTINAGANYHITSVLTGANCGDATNNYSYTAGTGAAGTTTINPFTTGAVTGDCTVTADFAIDTYTVDVSVTGTGTATPSPATVNAGNSTNVDTNAGPGYHIVSISGCGGTTYTPVYTTGNGVSSDTYATGALTGSNTIAGHCTVTAAFAINVYTVVATAPGAGSGGAVSCPATANWGTSPSCTITADTGYHAYDLFLDGSGTPDWSNHSMTGNNGTAPSPYSLGNTTADRTINVTFRLNTYLVHTATAGGGSGISNVTATSNPSNYADYGTSAQIFGNESDGSQIDNVSGSASCGGRTSSLTPDFSHTNNYTFGLITGPCTVTATFNPDVTLPVTTVFSIAPSTPSLTVPVRTFLATDNVHVKEYCITSTNDSDGCAWSATPQTFFTFSDETTDGIKTLYAWIRDYANNVSEPVTDQTTIERADRVELSQTGQNRCYDNGGLVVGCANTRQDGETRAGVVWPAPRFSAHEGSGATLIKDELSGLYWPESGNLAAELFETDGLMDWQSALDFIRLLNASTYGGYSDWRLPNRTELESLIHRQRSDSASLWLNTQVFSEVEPEYYWSSTTDLNTPSSAWAVTLLEGSTMSKDKASEGHYVFPVRGWTGDGRVQILSTNQADCYDAAGTLINCYTTATGARTGQDGDERAGVPYLLQDLRRPTAAPASRTGSL